MKILVFIQFEDGKINSTSLEAIVAAQSLSSSENIKAVTFSEEAANHLKAFDLNGIILCTDSKLDSYNPLFYLAAMEQTVGSENPELILFGHTYQARDWVPRLSARLDKPFISDCVGISSENGLKFTRSIYQGKINALVSSQDGQTIASFQSGSFRADNIATGSADVENLDVDLSNVANSIRPEDKFQEADSGVDLTQEDIIVAIGRGVGKEENLPLVQELAKSLGGEVASSRPIVDSGWLDPYHQIGSSGQNVSPKLYFALGISGAIQHVVGMKSSKNIVVINKDENAPFFEIADVGIHGDILEIMPKLTAAINEAQ